MYTFTSVNNRYTIYGTPVDGQPEYIVKFEPIGRIGRFSTNNDELARKLRAHPSFGRRFMEIGLTAKENPSIVDGIRSSESHPELGMSKMEPEELIEFGRLQASILRTSGEYRKDASAENIARYEALKQELET